MIRMERPRTVTVREKAARFADEQLPAIVLVCPGTIGEPRRGGDGLYAATWTMSVVAITQASDADLGHALASDLCVAATAVLAQTLPRADERIVSAMWAGEATDDIPVGEDQRSRCLFGRELRVMVQDVLCDLAGPPPGWDEPDPPSGDPAVDLGDLVTVETVGVTVTPVEET